MFKSLVNRMEKRVERILNTAYTPSPGSVEQALVGASLLYQKGVEMRLRRFRQGRIRPRKLPCPVISIGNIVAGGAGKTPMAVFLARRLTELGRRPAVVSRGYKGKLKTAAAVVGDGHNVFLDADTAGDEPFMMASLKKIPVVVGRDRYTAGRLALDRLNVDTIILDDGFQHLRLERDLDIVLLDSRHPLGNGRMLPAGRLRETPELCRDRIGCLVMTRCPEDGAAARPVNERLPEAFRGLPLFSARHLPIPFDGNGEGAETSALIKGRGVLLFSGIARNDRFCQTVRDLGAKVLDHLEFKDHYRYNRADFCAVRDRASALGADLILTTEKDWVKVDRAFDFQRAVLPVGIEVVLNEAKQFDQLLTVKVLARYDQ